MHRVRIALLALAVLAALLLATPETSAARRVPQGFLGVTWDKGLNSRFAQADAQWSSMSRSGVEAVRTVFSWAGVQPSELTAPDFRPFDVLVERAARRRLRLLPVVFEAPHWAEVYSALRNSPPYPDRFATFLGLLAGRYGARGSFWREHPGLRRLPIRDWQLWNEPNLGFYWNVPHGALDAWPGGYVELLAASRGTLAAADPGARIVTGGLSGEPWTLLRQLYRAGGRGLFDVAAIHPYNTNVKETFLSARLARGELRRAGDGRLPLWITELGWPAARGKDVGSGPRHLTTTGRRMAARLKQAFAGFAKRRRNRRYRVSRIFWHTWASSYRPKTEAGIWDYAGLVRTGTPFVAQPALKALRLIARRLEGCVKTGRGGCRR